jgi:uncharacterized protein YukE
MPLDIQVKGDSGSVRAIAQWLRQLSATTVNAGTAAREAVGISESGWTGPAGDGFRARVGAAVGEVDRIADLHVQSATALDKLANDMDTVKARLEQARGVATAARLAVTETQILEPGAPPAAPPPMPKNRCPTTAERDAFIAAEYAVADYEAKAKAFAECAMTVGEAGELEVVAQNAVIGFFDAMQGELTNPFSLLGLAASAVQVNFDRGPTGHECPGRQRRPGGAREQVQLGKPPS